MNSLEKTILRQLFGDKQYAQRVVPYIKAPYFQDNATCTIWRMYEAFFEKFQTVPSFTAVRIGLDSSPKLTEQEAKDAQEALSVIENEPFLGETQTPWVLEQSELWCQDRAMFVALQEAIKVIDDPKKSAHTIPDLMKEALSVSFDTHIGHDYFAQAVERYTFYHKAESRMPFNLDTMNALTNGGVPKKTLNVVLAGTNVGKSLALVHFASGYVQLGKNVLYITCEMAEEWIGQRCDANLFDIPMDDVIALPQVDFERKMNFIRSNTSGKLIIKEYPTATAHVGNFRTLLHELKLKQNFIPDVIMIDYLSICASSRVKVGNSVNSYMFNKFIAEELRGLAVEQDVPVWTAAQFNREGFKATDPGLEHVGESFGIPQTADFCFALVTTEELEKVGQISLIELKNRYNKKRSYQQHILGFDTPRMKIYELQAGQAVQQVSASPAVGQPSGALKGSLSKKRGVRQPSPLSQLHKENPDSE